MHGEIAQLLLDNNNTQQQSQQEFAEEPVDIETFLYGKDYLNLSIRLSAPQLDFVDNCSRIFGDNIYTQGVLQCGQGSGKDTCSMFVCLRLIYLLSCLENPQKYFNVGDQSTIDVINVATTAPQAKNIFFDGVEGYMANSPLFTKLSSLGGNESINSTGTMIKFPKNIRLISGNSENESWQGYNAFLIVLDEIDAFKAEVELQNNRSLRKKGADGVFNTATTLVASRFPNHGKVLSLSWPRFRGSFIQKRFATGKKEEKTYVPCNEDGLPYATWEFNPMRKRSDFDSFYEEGKEILAEAQFACNPPYASEALFKDTDKIFDAFDAYEDEFEEILWLEQKPIRNLSGLSKDKKYYIHVDLSLSQANAALCIAHNENRKVIVDRLEVWQPSSNSEVDIGGIEKYILSLKEMGYSIMNCTYDGFQSANSLQVLTKAGIIANKKSVDRSPEAYHTFKDLVHQEKVDGYYDKDLIKELLSLEILHNNKIVNRPGMLKDRADAVVGSVHNAMIDLDTQIVSAMADVNDVIGVKKVKKENHVNDIMKPITDKRGFVIMYDTCFSCNNSNGMEYSKNSMRSFAEEADRGWCLICDNQIVKKEGVWFGVN